MIVMGRVKVLSARSCISDGNNGWLFANTPGTLVLGDDSQDDARVEFDWAYMRDSQTGSYRVQEKVVVVVLKADLEALLE